MIAFRLELRVRFPNCFKRIILVVTFSPMAGEFLGPEYLLVERTSVLSWQNIPNMIKHVSEADSRSK